MTDPEWALFGSYQMTASELPKQIPVTDRLCKYFMCYECNPDTVVPWCDSVTPDKDTDTPEVIEDKKKKRVTLHEHVYWGKELAHVEKMH